MSEYGEPWSLCGEPGDCWIEDSGGGSIVEQSCDCSDAQICRLVQCTNALAGIPNPEAVREVIEAAAKWYTHGSKTLVNDADERLHTEQSRRDRHPVAGSGRAGQAVATKGCLNDAVVAVAR